MIRLMFVDKSRPLTHRGVRFPDGEAAEYETDDEGRIRVDLEPGEYRVEIETDEGWVEREFTLEGTGGLVVVDLRETNGDIKNTRQYFNTGSGRDLGERYEFLGELGRGGMGVVVRARDTLLNRDVAIKILTPELQGNQEAERIFLTEARSMAKLSHANLVSVHDVIAEGARSMMVVEFITGRNLEEVLQEKGTLSQKAVINIGIQVCRVVEYLHSQGVIHRDLKPANLMIEGDGTVKLIDFGLARSLEQIANKGTKIRGTPAYMAPEQVLGEELSEAVDIYQIGVTLFEALTGELPFSQGDVAYQHVHSEPPSVDTVGQNIFPALSELIDLCLSKDPEDRPASAQGLMEELQALREVLTSGRISAVQISDAGLGTDSAGQPASTPQPAALAATEDASNQGGSVGGASAGSSGGLEESVGTDDAPDMNAASGPTRWLVPALIVLVLVVGAAFFFGQDLAGPSGEGRADGEHATAESVEAADEAEQRDDDPGERIVAARAVESAGQIVQSASSAARTVVELAPDAPSRESAATSGAREPTPGPSDTESAGARESRTQSGRASDRDPSASSGDAQTPDEAAAGQEESSGESASSEQADEETLGDIAEETVSEPTAGDEAGDSTDERSDSREAFKVAPLAPDDEKSEADSPASASSPTNATGGTESSDDARGETQPSASDKPEVASESDSKPSRDSDEKSKDDTSKEERETRSAPVSF
jgi:serine/threonine-protein kinase